MFDLIEKQNATRKRGTAANAAAPVTALYERLSCEDETEHESNSITNQKSLLQACTIHGNCIKMMQPHQ